jgi:hypothetical protein
LKTGGLISGIFFLTFSNHDWLWVTVQLLELKEGFANRKEEPGTSSVLLQGKSMAGRQE